jgi:hypothetical protein
MNYTYLFLRERKKIQEGKGRRCQCGDQDHGREFNHSAKVVQVWAKVHSDLEATSTELDRKEHSWGLTAPFAWFIKASSRILGCTFICKRSKSSFRLGHGSSSPLHCSRVSACACLLRHPSNCSMVITQASALSHYFSAGLIVEIQFQLTRTIAPDAVGLT